MHHVAFRRHTSTAKRPSKAQRSKLAFVRRMKRACTKALHTHFRRFRQWGRPKVAKDYKKKLKKTAQKKLKRIKNKAIVLKKKKKKAAKKVRKEKKKLSVDRKKVNRALTPSQVAKAAQKVKEAKHKVRIAKAKRAAAMRKLRARRLQKARMALSMRRAHKICARAKAAALKLKAHKSATVAPVDPCKKWKAEHKANAEIAKALKAEVKFAGGASTLKAQGKKTLDNAAKILIKYPWMTITVTGHSDAPKGARCTALVIGRANATEKYLKSKGVKNKMTRPVGKCGKKRAIEIIGNAAGRGKSPCHAKLVRAPVQRRVRRL